MNLEADGKTEGEWWFTRVESKKGAAILEERFDIIGNRVDFGLR